MPWITTPEIPPQIQERIICSISAAVKYQVPANIVLAVAEKEAGKPGQWVRNSNGTHDVGSMQFNTAYLGELARYGITANDVAASGCYSFDLAAWRLRKHIRNDKGDLWTRAANYHSRTYRYNVVYRADLMVKAVKWADWLEARFVTFDITKPGAHVSTPTVQPISEKTITHEKQDAFQPRVANSRSSLKKSRYSDLISRAADKYGVHPNLVHAVITTESAYNVEAKSPAGALGLMQLMPDTARRFGVTDRLDAEQNIDGGVHYLRDLLAMFNNNVKLAVAAYNAGENAVIKYKYAIPPYPETQTYVKRVLGLFSKGNAEVYTAQISVEPVSFTHQSAKSQGSKRRPYNVAAAKALASLYAPYNVAAAKALADLNANGS